MDARIDAHGKLHVEFDRVEEAAVAAYLRGCPQLPVLLDYVDDKEWISAEQKQQIDEHLGGCPTCREEVARAREFNAYLGTPAGQRYLDEIGKRVEKKMRAQQGWQGGVPSLAYRLA